MACAGAAGDRNRSGSTSSLSSAATAAPVTSVSEAGQQDPAMAASCSVAAASASGSAAAAAASDQRWIQSKKPCSPAKNYLLILIFFWSYYIRPCFFSFYFIFCSSWYTICTYFFWYYSTPWQMYLTLTILLKTHYARAYKDQDIARPILLLSNPFSSHYHACLIKHNHAPTGNVNGSKAWLLFSLHGLPFYNNYSPSFYYYYYIHYLIHV